MLTALTIRDVVLIDRLVLEFRPGLSALTGETGAGKSILLDALGLALGGRGEARLVRHGADQAMVTAAFSVPPRHPALPLLGENGIDGGDEAIVLRRSLGIDGRSRAFINDQAVSVALLRRVGETLVEIHGQFESQRLLNPAFHRDLLDGFAGLTPQVDALADARRTWARLEDELAATTAHVAAAKAEEAYLRHARDELLAFAPVVGEEEALNERRCLLQQGEKLMQGLDDAARSLAGGAGGRGVADALRSAHRALERVAGRAQGRIDGVLAALDRAAGETAEAQALLEKAVADLDLDPRHLEDVEERLFALRALARKHGCGADDLPDVCERFGGQLAAIEVGGERQKQLEQEVAAARRAYCAGAEALSSQRAAAARRLDDAVAAELEPLRLGKARFSTRVERLEEASWGEKGWDRVVFEVATNPGVPPGPLSRIASGGELARFMLALKVVLGRSDPVNTVIFDEVDAGVGGAVAAAVGERLARLAEEVQVLVVTHSPQVAARGAHQLRVSKTLEPENARTRVDLLDADERREEIARMLAGARITDEARAAATSLLAGSGP